MSDRQILNGQVFGDGLPMFPPHLCCVAQVQSGGLRTTTLQPVGDAAKTDTPPQKQIRTKFSYEKP